MSQLEYISRNGGTVLLYDGYQFHKKKEYKNKHVFWVCSQRKKLKCMGNITISNETVEKENPHTCEQNFNKNIVDVQLDLCVKKSKQLDGTPLPQIYQNTISTLQDKGIDLLCKIPQFHNVKNRMYYNKNKEAGVKKINCVDVVDVEVPQQFEPFLLADYGFEGNRIIIFCSVEMRSLMGKIKMFLSDGTFKSCPKPFAQLYVIHGDLGSNENSTNIVPLVYALLSGKTKGIYETLFNLIKSCIPDWQPKKFKTDYEVGAMQALLNVFPEIVLNGCYYHYNKSIWKKARELMLTKEKNTRRIVGLTAVLPLLPYDKIKDGWNYIKQDTLDLQDTERVPIFLKYFEKFWLRSEDFIKIWSVFGQRHRTTNFLEGWNFKLNSNVSKKRVDIIQLLNVLLKDSAYYVVCSKQILKNQSPTKRNITHIKNDMYILKSQNQLLNGEISVGHFLHKMK